MNELYSEIKQYCGDHGATLVAVSKTKTTEEILTIYNQGQKIFGENQVQELVTKHEVMPKDIEWHLVGHLQTNKVKHIAPFVSLIHSADSWKLIGQLNKQGKKNNRVIPLLLQIFIAQEETKFGFSYDEAQEILTNPQIKDFANIQIRGLMGMATLTDNEEQIRKEFRSLRNFFEKMKSEIANPKSAILSMGMSSDYKIAIEEGSNMVRIGSAVFGGRKEY